MSRWFVGLLFGLCTLAAPNLFAAELSGKKVLFVNSYHEGLASSDDQVQGALEILRPKGAAVKVIYMDTKRNGADSFRQAAALKVRAEIQRYKPDLVIASDDSASKDLIVPYFKGNNLPFVFCGVNWDASAYGFPASNVTGVLELEPIKPMLKLLRQYAKGPRLGFIGADTLPERKNIDIHKNVLKIDYAAGHFVGSFDDFKQRFLQLQDEVDMIVTASPIGMEGWDLAAARAFMEANAKVPVGGTVEWVSQFTLLTISGILKEQGTLAGAIAVRILKGEKPSSIPIVENTDGRLYINMAIANRLGVTFDPKLLRTATLVR